MTRPRILLVIVLLAALVIGLTAVDVWKVRGTVVDAASGLPLDGAKLLISFHAEEFGPPIPHAWTASSQCVYADVLQTTESGQFALWRVTWGWGLKDKRFSVEAFKPGWFQRVASRDPINTWLVGAPAKILIQLEPDKGERWSFVHDGGKTTPLTRDSSSPLYEKTMSQAVTSTASFGRTIGGCDVASGETLVAEALAYAVHHARTSDELSYIRNRCIDAMNRMRATKSTREVHHTAVPGACNQFRFAQ